MQLRLIKKGFKIDFFGNGLLNDLVGISCKPRDDSAQFRFCTSFFDDFGYIMGINRGKLHGSNFCIMMFS